MSSSHEPSDPKGPTGKLSTWISSVALDDIPEEIRTRAKYLILDGVACGLIAAQLPWSKTAAEAVFALESPGNCSIIGWDRVSLKFLCPQEIHKTMADKVPERWTYGGSPPEQHLHPGV